MIRRNVRLRGLGLITMLAMVPMLIVITSVSAVLVSRVLRVQREATYRVANTDAASRLAKQIRTDAATMSDVAIDAAEMKLVLTDAAEEISIEYIIDNGTVVRNDSRADAPNLSDWSFVHANVQFSLEETTNGDPLIWLRIEYEVELEKRLVQVAKMATAIRVGDGETQQ